MNYPVTFRRIWALSATGLASLLLFSEPTLAARLHAAPIAAPFSLENFFNGRAVARGHFESGIAGVSRDFTVRTKGSWNGSILTLVEDIAYDDGQKERKTWRITKTAPGQYTGLRDDVIGSAVIAQAGDSIKLDYDADVTGKEGATTRVRFADVIVPEGPRGAHNTATVYKYFLPIGTVDIHFKKIGR